MTTIKDALISKLKNLPDDITLDEILKLIRDEWKLSKFESKQDDRMNDTKLNTLKSRFEKELKEYREGILKLGENWDGMGSNGFGIELWSRVSQLVRDILFYLWENMIEIPTPVLLPCSDGSIDINWETKKFDLLVNIPPTNQDLVNIYGEKAGSREDEIEVRIKFDIVKPVIIEWLKIIM